MQSISSESSLHESHLGQTIKIILCLGLFGFAGLTVYQSPQHFSSASSQPSVIALTLTYRPPTLPADGGSYSSLVLEFKNSSSGVPFIPQTNLTVLMTSSNPEIANVAPSIVFPAGSLFVTARLNTSLYPGGTTISAFTTGYPSASLVVNTAKVGGMPSALDVFVSPSTLPPDEKLNASVVVEAVDSFGNPVKLAINTKITLSSSNSQYGTVPQSLTISAGQSFAEAIFKPTYVAGKTVITASAAGFSPGSSIMTTVGPIARRLVVSIAPSLILASTKENATVSIQLQDTNTSTPALASSDINVVLTSSNTSVAVIPTADQIVTIKAGHSYALTQILSGGSPGNATITASAQGYVKASAVVSAEPFVPNVIPNKLALYFAPTTLLPDSSEYQGSVVVELQYLSNGQVYPMNDTSNVAVYVRSSNNASMFVDPLPITIPKGYTHTSLYVNSTYLPGTALITAQSEGLTTDTEGLVSSGLTPNALTIQFTPNILLAGGTYNSSVVIGLLNNATGEPAKAPVDTVVTLSSSSTSLVQVQTNVIIRAGQTYATASLSTFYGVSGSGLIVASASNFTSANATLSLVNPAATNLDLYAIPGMILANNQSYSNIAVQLQDSQGNPEKTDVPVLVQLATESLGTGAVTTQVTIPPGNTFVVANLSSSTTPGSINISAFASGYQSGKVGLASILLPLKAQVHVNSPNLLFGGGTNISVLVAYNNSPLSGATVVWPSVVGTFSNMVNSTNSTGYATASYKAGSVQGTIPLHIKVQKLGYVTYTANASISVTNPNPPQQTNTQSNGILAITILSIPVVFLIPVAVGVPAAAFFVIRRRRAGAMDYVEEE